MKTQHMAAAMLALVFAVAASPGLAGMIDVGGTISVDSAWTSQDTVRVAANVTVGPSAELTIGPGTVVLFADNTYLNVQGYLRAEGAAQDRIVFTSAQPSPAAGDWGSIKFEPGSDGLVRNCNVSYATRAFHADRSSPEFDSCFVVNFGLSGFYLRGPSSGESTTPVILNSTACQTDAVLLGAGTGIHVYLLVDVAISGCLVDQCGTGIYFQGAGSDKPNFQITGSTIANNFSYGIRTYSSG
jgi:hypothetical protein